MDWVVEKVKHLCIEIVSMPLQASERMFWVYLLTATLAAYLVYRRYRKEHQSFFQFLLPKRLYQNPSTHVDVKYMFVNKIFLVFVLSPVVYFAPQLTRHVGRTFAEWTGASLVATPPSWGILVLYTLAIGVAIDFSQYISHLLLHKLPVLWEFHKVHHSATTLTPFTTFRVHPVEFIVHTTLGLVAGTLVGSLFYLLHPTGLNTLGYLGVPALTLFFNIVANLRHSHVWLAYNDTLSHVLVSPAQHQIHHSNDPKHFDKNLGILFSLWDWAFGTLYIPDDQDRVSLQYGLGTDEEREFSSVSRLYFKPFSAVWTRLRKKVHGDRATERSP